MCIDLSKTPSCFYSKWLSNYAIPTQNIHDQMHKNIFFYSGERMYPSANNIAYGGDGKVSKEGVDRMVADLEKQ